MTKRPFFNSTRLPLLVTIILTGFFLILLKNTDNRHISVNEDLAHDRAVVLTKDCNPQLLSEIILNNGYAETKKDADFIAQVLIDRQNENGALQSLCSPK